MILRASLGFAKDFETPNYRPKEHQRHFVEQLDCMLVNYVLQYKDKLPELMKASEEGISISLWMLMEHSQMMMNAFGSGIYFMILEVRPEFDVLLK